MHASGQGIFYDGTTSERHLVTVELDPAALLVRAAEGHLLARWPYQELEHLSAPEGRLRVGRLRDRVLARLEVREPALAAAIDDLAASVDRTGALERRGRRKVIVWTLAAAASLFAVAVFGVPAIADRLAPLVPRTVEYKLGEAVDAQVRAMLDPAGRGEAFECGNGESEKAGRAALDRLVGRLAATDTLAIPLSIKVVRRTQANAFAIPGGHIYVFEGLIEKAETPDELAGVIAHEIGHVAHRDGTRAVFQAAGLSFLFGMVLGDFVGGGAVVIAARQVLQSSYSREVEKRADRFAVELMKKTGADPHALATMLTRIAGANHPGMKILRDHPETADRVAAITAAAAPNTRGALLDAGEWAALKRICSGA
jgi:Zn-dependent protease with chaperone function